MPPPNSIAPKPIRSCSPHIPVRPRILLYPPRRCAGVFLVDCCVFSVVGHLRSSRHILFFLCPISRRKRWENAPPHTFRHSRAPSRISSPPIAPTFGWLLNLLFKWRLSKAKVPLPSLFLMGRISAPLAAPTARNKTNRTFLASAIM